MTTNVAIFLFLAAGVVAMFAFISIAVWVIAQTSERRARDRFALLKTLAEHSNESSARVLEMLREHDERQAERKTREERRGLLLGGLIVLACGAGICVMLAMLTTKNSGEWTVGLIPLLVGAVLFFFGLFTKPRRAG